MDKVKEEVMAKWTPDKVEEAAACRRRRSQGRRDDGEEPAVDRRVVHGPDAAQHRQRDRPRVVHPAAGARQRRRRRRRHNIFRGHDNVQGATDVGPNPDSLPGYYGVATGAWKHFAAVWGVDYEWMKKQFAEGMMEKPGMTVSRWIDGVLEKNELIDQGPNLRALVMWGHAPNSQTRGKEMVEALKKLDLVVVIDPYPSATAQWPRWCARTTSTCCRPARSSRRRARHGVEPLAPVARASNQPAVRVADRPRDHARVREEVRLGQGVHEELRSWKPDSNKFEEPTPESILKEINKATWTIGYTGQSPERSEAPHEEHADVRREDAAGNGRTVRRRLLRLAMAVLRQPELKHPGSPNLYETSRNVMDGGGNFRANFGVERDGVNLLAEDGSYSKGADLTTGYPEFDHVLMKKLGWWDELNEAEKKAAEGKNWKTDLSGGIQRVVLKITAAIRSAMRKRAPSSGISPMASRSTASRSIRRARTSSPSTRRTTTRRAFWRLPTLYKTVQQENVAKDVAKNFPLILTSGRLVEYEGGGEETRSNPYLAELQQENFIEISPKDANDRGVRDGEYVWVKSPTGAQIKVKAMVTERVGPGTTFIPFHFSGWWQGKDMLEFYPEGAAPIVRGEAVNTATTYGYDSVTMMQETKTTLCQVAKV
jgi:formate dehydrogenase major subunit